MLLPITWNCRIFGSILWSGLSYIKILTICLLLVYFVSAVGSHCFDLIWLDIMSKPIVSYELLHASCLTLHQPLSNSNVSHYPSNPQTCHCKESTFFHEPHGHVITGYLRVIEKTKLRGLVHKRLKYRDLNRVIWKAMETLFF